ncbi:MAG: hypothetical protein ACLGIR_01165 [Actinomycetes bacterium]
MDTTTRPPVRSDTRPLRDALVVPYVDADAGAVRAIFAETVVLGSPAPVDPDTLDGYARLCLDWYLGPGARHARVVLQDGEVVGYLLACLDQTAYDRWVRPRAVRWALGAARRAATGRLRGASATFVRLRVLDGVGALRHGVAPPFPAHGHLNLTARVRDGRIGHRLAAEMDRMVAEAGLAGWFGEVNVPAGRSLAAIERAGARVVHRVPSRTFSWLAGTAVERATVARPLAARTDSVDRV